MECLDLEQRKKELDYLINHPIRNNLVIVRRMIEGIEQCCSIMKAGISNYEDLGGSDVPRCPYVLECSSMPLPKRDVAALSIVMDLAWTMLHRPYIWGGDDPIKGFDCSGMQIELLKSVGILPREGDWTAQGLWNYFQNKVVKFPDRGCLVFWGNSSDSVVHIELCWNSKLCIGASGGGSKTKTVEDAIAQNAYVKLRPISSRSGVVGYVDPFMLTEGGE